MELDDYLGLTFLGPCLQCFGRALQERDCSTSTNIIVRTCSKFSHTRCSRNLDRERALSDVHVGGLRKFLHNNVVEKVALLEKACNVSIDEIGKISAIFRSSQELIWGKRRSSAQRDGRWLSFRCDPTCGQREEAGGLFETDSEWQESEIARNRGSRKRTVTHTRFANRDAIPQQPIFSELAVVAHYVHRLLINSAHYSLFRLPR